MMEDWPCLCLCVCACVCELTWAEGSLSCHFVQTVCRIVLRALVKCALSCRGSLSVLPCGLQCWSLQWQEMPPRSWFYWKTKWISKNCNVTHFYMNCLRVSAWWPFPSTKLTLKSIQRRKTVLGIFQRLICGGILVSEFKEEPLKPFRAYVQWPKLVVKMCNSGRYVCFDGEIVKMILIFFDFVNLN